MPEEKILATRLITQNLLFSAALFEHDDHLDWSALRDLSIFIDLFCLYDEATIIGRASDPSAYRGYSDFFGLLDDTRFVKVDRVDSEAARKVTQSARKHLLTFLRDEHGEQFDQLLEFALHPSAADYALSYRPDGREDVHLGDEWLRTTPSRRDVLEQLKAEADSDITRGTTFLVRTFLYYAYADTNAIAFTPDSARTPVLKSIFTTVQKTCARLPSC
jgi:hypothetical protein